MSKHQAYGNVKMRGKKEKLLPCKCCVAENRKSDLEQWAESNLRWEFGAVNIHPDYQKSIENGADRIAKEMDEAILRNLGQKKI